MEIIVEYIFLLKGDFFLLFKFLVFMMDYDLYLGCLVIGCILFGVVCVGDWIYGFCSGEVNILVVFDEGKVIKFMKKNGMMSVFVNSVGVGDIVFIVGFFELLIGYIVVVVDVMEVFLVVVMDLFILLMIFSVNDFLLGGCDGN